MTITLTQDYIDNNTINKDFLPVGDGKTITLATSSFSPFAIVYKDNAKSTGSTSSSSYKLPQTGV